MTLHVPGPDLANQRAWKAFTQAVALAPDEELLLLHDGTLFGSGSKGLAVTNRRVIGYDSRSAQAVPHADLICAEALPLPPHTDLFDRLVLHCASEHTVTLELEAGRSEVSEILDVIRAHANLERWTRYCQEHNLSEPAALAPTIPVDESALLPVCPHCEQEIERLCMRNVASALGRRYLYFCPKCRKVLGISQRKGYVLG